MALVLLKILAAVLMLIDHVGMVFFPQYSWLRMIGRLAMPLFAYSIATGYYFTARSDAAALVKPSDLTSGKIAKTSWRNSRFLKYLLHIAIFALVSQIPFRLLLRSVGILHNGLNIGVTWLLSLIVLRGFIGLPSDKYPPQTAENSQQPDDPQRIFWLGAAVVATVVSIAVHMDYGLYGVLYPLACYGIVLAVRHRAEQSALPTDDSVVSIHPPTAGTRPTGIASYNGYAWGGLGQALLNLMGIFALGFWPYQALAMLSLPLMAVDSGRKSRISKWFFYIFYPLHMLVLAWLVQYLR